MLLRGPPGLGKTMFAKRLVSILPPLSVNATLGRISVPGCVAKDANLMRPVLRCPHHSASVTAMTGSIKSPGEMSLAHHGILLMDELPEFRRDIIESLREPMESGVAHVSRAAGQVSWPAEFQWIATANNCPCGWLFSQRKRCTCSSQKIQRYMAKLSGPLLDRVCMHIVFEELPEGSKQTSLSVKEMREKVAAACKLMQAQPLAHWQKQEEALAPKLQKEFLSKRSLKRFFSVARSVAALRGQTILAEQDLNRARTWTLKAASKKLGFEDSY
jgi:magnesium chelatase family protein